MTTMSPARRRAAAAPTRRRRPRARWVIVVGAAAVLLGLVALALRDDPAGPAAPRVDRAALERYEAELVPVVQRGGSVVEQGMKPAIEDLTSKHIVPPSFIAKEADGWVADLTAVRRDVAALTPPAGLAEVERLLDQALAGYVAAAEKFRAATQVEGAARDRLVDDGIARAETADDRYDQASAIIQAARRAHGLQPSVNFPDPGHEDG